MAFLDALDVVTLWLPEPQQPEALMGCVTVRVAGKPVRVVAVQGGERAAPKRDPELVVLPGTIQVALGGREWDPAGRVTQLQKVGSRYELVVRLPAGRYEYKLARGGSWDENYGAGFVAGGPNIVLVVPQAQLVRFVADFEKKTLQDSLNQPEQVPPPTTLAPRSRPTEENRFQSVRLRLARKLTPAEVALPMQVRRDEGAWETIYAREALSNPVFFYRGDDLGARWSRTQTRFRVWSPVASSVTLVLGTKRMPMQRGEAGTWFVTVPGDWHTTPYHYELVSYGKTRRAADIYGVAALADSSRSVVVELARTNPPGWPAPRPFHGKPTDAVLYELHVRDFTIQPSSGVKPAWRGKYLGVMQKRDYLKNLGITHVHLLPLHDFNAQHSKGYNWGYETTLFNVPEEQYATNPDDPLCRLRELKQLVYALQKDGLSVVLDVVYNHSVPSEGPLSAFWECVPYYYFRTNDKGDVLNESGVGNALHDERPMVRKFIRESLLFWTREYRIDGFRFDLLGMFTKETVADLAQAVRRANPTAVLYGEPWTGGGPLRFGKGDQKGLPMAVFNDHFRNLVRGDLDGAGPGFAQGTLRERGALERAIAGSVEDFAATPSESVNYVSAHDNRTLWDKIALATEPSQRAAAVRLAQATVLLSQGIPFLEGGVELGRTKGGSTNSYNAGDAANQYDWHRAPAFSETHAYVQGLIALRRAHPAFRLSTAEQVKQCLTFVPLDEGIALHLDGRAAGDPWYEILVLLYAGKTPRRFSLPEGRWSVVVEGAHAGTQARRAAQGTLSLEPLAAVVLFR